MIQYYSGHLRQISRSTATINAVTEFIQSHLAEETGLAIYNKDPEEFQKSCQTNHFSNSMAIFLYRILADTNIKPHSFKETTPAQEAPIGIILKYIITAFDKQGKCSTPEAHMMLSQAAMSLHQISFPCLTAADAPPGLHPEELKITFEEVSAKLLSQLFQCPTDKYRFSLGFQVRPVMITRSEAKDPFYTTEMNRNAVAGKDNKPVYHSFDSKRKPLLYPRITSISVPYLQAGDGFFISGENLQSEQLKIMFNSHEIDILDRSSNLLSCHLPPSQALPLSAGSYQLTGEETLPGKETSQIAGITVHLLPIIKTISISANERHGENITGRIYIEGNSLGAPGDEITAGLYAGEEPVAIFYEVNIETEQTILQIEITPNDNIPAGTYRLVLRVNGEYALNKPEIRWGLHLP